MSLSEKLSRIQTTLKAPKNLYNKFGKYKYRNSEGICEAVKPYLEQNKCYMVLKDDMLELGGRFYIRATATLYDTESDDCIKATAFAREAESKKGMDESQITGAASSYARKYALNGLFLLDDTKDADSNEYSEQGKENTDENKEAEQRQVELSKISEIKVKSLEERCRKEGIELSKLMRLYKVSSLSDLSELQFRNINDHWEDIKKV